MPLKVAPECVRQYANPADSEYFSVRLTSRTISLQLSENRFSRLIGYWFTFVVAAAVSSLGSEIRKAARLAVADHRTTCLLRGMLVFIFDAPLALRTLTVSTPCCLAWHGAACRMWRNLRRLAGLRLGDMGWPYAYVLSGFQSPSCRGSLCLPELLRSLVCGWCVSVPFMSGLSLFDLCFLPSDLRGLSFSPLHVGALFVWLASTNLRVSLLLFQSPSCRGSLCLQPTGCHARGTSISFSPLHVGALFVCPVAT